MIRNIFSIAIFIWSIVSIPVGVDARAMFQERTSSMTDDEGVLDKSAVSHFAPPISLSWLHNGQISATAGNTGAFGSYFSNLYDQPLCDGETCPSFISPEGSGLEYLFAGAVWIGGIVGGDTLVSVAADGWVNEMEMIPPIPSAMFDGLGDQSAWMLFTDTITDPHLTGTDPFEDRPHIPLHVRIANRAYTWNSEPENQTILYDMVITNIGEQTIEDGYVAFYFDADVYHMSIQQYGFTDDVTGSIREAGIGYIVDNDGDPQGGMFTAESPTRLFAFKPLVSSFTAIDTNFNWWISNGNAELDYGPQPVDEFGNPECDFGGHFGTPTGDRSKYCMMSHPGWDFDQIYTADTVPGWTYPYDYSRAIDFADGFDTRFLMSFGPFTLMPDSSVRILYTTFTGDSVIHVVDNLANLPNHPDQYLANLNLSHVLANADIAAGLAESLINPLNPVTGLYAVHNDLDSVVIEWDPWGFADVEGYEIYLHQVPADSLPYPGEAPPWIHPSAADLAASVDQVYQHTFPGLEPYGIYVASVANRTAAKGIGAMSQPFQIQPGGRPPAPQVADEYIFVEDYFETVLHWTPPEGVEVDHYNIYKFANPEEAQGKYYPRYDTGQFASETSPRDSFYVDDIWYYYYSMEPYASVGAGTTVFRESTTDSSVYIITAITTSGLESAFSPDITVFSVPNRDKDILVISCPMPISDYVDCDSLFDYYSDLLAGYDFDMYSFKDTLGHYIGRCKPNWWLDLMPYKMVIIDAAWRFDILESLPPESCPTLPEFIKYAWSKGVLVYFGSFFRLAEMSQSDPAGYYAADNDTLVDGFGVDSLFSPGNVYYYIDPDGKNDSLGGFIEAEAVAASLPDIHFDPSRHPYRVSNPWPDSTGPLAAAFFNNTNAVPTHVYRSKYPSTSLAEGLPVGIMSDSYPSRIYSFGFRPWYMQLDEMRALIDYMMSPVSDVVSAGTIVEPDTMNFYWAYALTPMNVSLSIGHFSIGYTAGDVDQSTILVNDELMPGVISVVDNSPGFTGPALTLTIPMPEFLGSYGTLWGRRPHPYTVSATMNDGTRFLATGSVIIKGVLPGDANGDDCIDIGDAVSLIEFVFRDGQAPAVKALGDVNGDCRIDVGDAIYLINYIFRNGPEPQIGCAE